MNKEPGDENKEEDRMVWRRENDIRSELERARQELVMATDRAHEAEKLCMTFEQRVQLAEERYNDFMEKREAEHETLAPPIESSSSSTHMDDDRIWESSGRTSHSALMAHVLSGKLAILLLLLFFCSLMINNGPGLRLTIMKRLPYRV